MSPRPPPSFWVDLAERVGVPTALLAALLYGMFLLLKPVSIAVKDNITEQTNLLSDMAADLAATRIDTALTRELVEAEREERKAEKLIEIDKKLDIFIREQRKNERKD